MLSQEDRLAKKDELLTNYAVKSERIHTINQLLKAYCMFERDVDYIVTEDGKVKIVDEQTGRIMEGRRWSDGLHPPVGPGRDTRGGFLSGNGKGTAPYPQGPAGRVISSAEQQLFPFAGNLFEDILFKTAGVAL